MDHIAGPSLEQLNDEDKVLETISPFNGTVLKSDLLADNEAKLKEMLGDD